LISSSTEDSLVFLAIFAVLVTFYPLLV
jgi:hypothetical protein